MRTTRAEHGVRGCRLLLSLIALAVSAAWPSPVGVLAQATSPVVKINEEAARAEINVERLRGDISVLSGSGGNIVVFSGTEGKLLVDAGIGVSRPKIEAALAALGPVPPRYVVNTHWHWDHTDGNEWLHSLGATIVAHEGVLRRLSATTRVEDWDYTFRPWPAGGRPTVTFKKDKTIKFGGETVLLRNFGVGHTDGDAVVYFKRADVLALGDIFWNGVYPFVDNSTGGGIDEVIRWVNASLALASERTVIVPGHGPVGTRAQLVEFRDMLVGVRERVARLKRQGKTVEEVVAARPTADYDAKWGGFVIDGPFFTRLVYAGIKGGQK